MRRIFLILAMSLVFISCGRGHDETSEKCSDPIPCEKEKCPEIKVSHKVVVNFLPLTIYLSGLEKNKLWETFKGIQETKGHWLIVGHGADSRMSLMRSREVETYLRHQMYFDVAGAIQGKDDGDWLNPYVEVNFVYY